MAVENPLVPGEWSTKLVREKMPDAVLAQHMKALNTCDWKGLMQQYPDSYELRDIGSLTKGRVDAAASMWTGIPAALFLPGWATVWVVRNSPGADRPIDFQPGFDPPGDAAVERRRALGTRWMS